MRVGKDNYTIYIESTCIAQTQKRLSEHVFFLNDKIFGGKLTVMFLFFKQITQYFTHSGLQPLPRPYHCYQITQHVYA